MYAIEDLGVSIRGYTQSNVAWIKVSAAECNHNNVPLARTNDRLVGNRHCIDPQRR